MNELLRLNYRLVFHCAKCTVLKLNLARANFQSVSRPHHSQRLLRHNVKSPTASSGDI